MRLPLGCVISAICLVGLLAAPAQATIPSGNLLLNGDGEFGTAVSNELDHACPQGWTCYSGNPTLVRFGTTTFPSTADSAQIEGGKNFFAGGPGGTSTQYSFLRQIVDVGVQPEFTAGTVKATFSGCLGGWQDQDDAADLLPAAFPGPGGTGEGIGYSVGGPRAAERGNKTSLLPRSKTEVLPPGTQSVRFTLAFVRETGAPSGAYDDGYADNLSLTFGPASGPNPPAATCKAPAGGGGGGSGGGGGGGGGGTGGQGGGTGTKGVLSFGSARIGSDGRARVRISCNTAQVSRCKGTLSASLTRASSSARTKRGTARFSIRSLKSRTIKIRLRRSDLRKIRNYSKSQLNQRRLRLKTTTTVGKSKLRQTSLLRLSRPV